MTCALMTIAALGLCGWVVSTVRLARVRADDERGLRASGPDEVI